MPNSNWDSDLWYIQFPSKLQYLIKLSSSLNSMHEDSILVWIQWQIILESMGNENFVNFMLEFFQEIENFENFFNLRLLDERQPTVCDKYSLNVSCHCHCNKIVNDWQQMICCLSNSILEDLLDYIIFKHHNYYL